MLGHFTPIFYFSFNCDTISEHFLFIYLIKQDIRIYIYIYIYVAYSRPNGRTDCAETCCGHSGVAGGCYRLKEFEIFLSTFFFNFFFHGNRRALQQVKYETIAKKFADFISFFVVFLNYTKIKWRQIFEIPSIHEPSLGYTHVCKLHNFVGRICLAVFAFIYRLLYD